MFCSNCGQELSDNAKFCSSCGQQLNAGTGSATPAAPVSEQQPQQTSSAQALIVMQTNRKLSMLKMITCHVVFMPDKIILAYLSKERQKAESDRLSKEIKASGKGFFKGSAAMMGYWADYHKKYYNMSAEQILSEDPENMLIHYNTVSQILFHAHDTHYSSDGDQRTSGGKLHISLAGGETLKFSHSIGNIKEIRETLTQLFGSRLKYKR